MEGDSTEVGIFFENLQDKSQQKVSVLSINKPSQLIVMVPALPAGRYQLNIVTQYKSGGGKEELVKTPREGLFDKVLTVS